MLGLALLGLARNKIEMCSRTGKHRIYQIDDKLHILLQKPAGSNGRSSDPYARCKERGTGIERYHVLVDCDIRLDKLPFGHFSCKVRELGTQVYQQQMVIGTSRNHLVAP